jgi:hypothetical protein
LGLTTMTSSKPNLLDIGGYINALRPPLPFQSPHFHVLVLVSLWSTSSKIHFIRLRPIPNVGFELDTTFVEG